MNALFHETNCLTLGKDLVADTTSETTTAVEDMSGYEEITWLVMLGDVDAAAVLTFAVKENTASSVSSPTPTAVACTAVTAGTLTSGNLVVTESSGNIDDKIMIITVLAEQLSKRYCFLSITATGESYEVDKIACIKRKSRNVPVTQSSDVYATAYAAG